MQPFNPFPKSKQAHFQSREEKESEISPKKKLIFENLGSLTNQELDKESKVKCS